MTPIQRVSEKSQALAVLGLSSNANTADVRNAFKALALEKHPDQGVGSTSEFALITDAYVFLKENAVDLGIPDAPKLRRPVTTRPLMQATETEFTEDVIAECKACLQGAAEHAEHVSTILHRMGRKLTYFVPTEPANGPNEVVVPTGELVDSRHTLPQVVPVDARDIAAGVYDVPSNVCEKLFPGARSVKIRFAS
ncbi:J domain-containing protein [Rhodobacteraceae bacterium]|nr:J domain-containing protein [Paracoccaceae bacterium]